MKLLLSSICPSVVPRCIWATRSRISHKYFPPKPLCASFRPNKHAKRFHTFRKVLQSFFLKCFGTCIVFAVVIFYFHFATFTATDCRYASVCLQIIVFSKFIYTLSFTRTIFCLMESSKYSISTLFIYSIKSKPKCVKQIK